MPNKLYLRSLTMKPDPKKITAGFFIVINLIVFTVGAHRYLSDRYYYQNIDINGRTIGSSRILSWRPVDDSRLEVDFSLNNTDNQAYQIRCSIKAHDGQDDEVTGMPLTDIEYFELLMPAGQTDKKQSIDFAQNNSGQVSGIHLGCSGLYAISAESATDRIIIPQATDSQAVRTAIRRQVNEAFTLFEDFESALGIQDLTPTSHFTVILESGPSNNPALTVDDFVLNVTNQSDSQITVVCYVAMISAAQEEVYDDDIKNVLIRSRQSSTDIFILNTNQPTARPYYNCSGFM